MTDAELDWHLFAPVQAWVGAYWWPVCSVQVRYVRRRKVAA